MLDAAAIDKKLSKSGQGLPPFLQRKIKFVEAVQDDSPMTTVGYASAGKAEGKRDGQQGARLFDASKLSFNWSKIYRVGPGLVNLGNTCFLNSVIQSLLYSAPFANLLLEQAHAKKCRVDGFCIVCELERLSQQAFTSGQGRRHVSPNGVVANIKIIGKQFRLGRQEDAHEFLRYLIEAMQRVCLHGLDPKLDHRVKETSLVHSIFGGYLQSRIACHSCRHESRIHEPLLDLSLEVRQAGSVHHALKQFTAAELLSKGNRYKCEACGKLSDASKQYQVLQPPNILTVHLKRFQMLPQGMIKINRDIEFGPEFDLTPYMVKGSGMALYDLYSVLVHEGQSCHSGHYHCFVKNSNGCWYSMNDESVHQVSLATVLKQKAYILFYQKRAGSKDAVPGEKPVSALASKPAEAPLAAKAAPVVAQKPRVDVSPQPKRVKSEPRKEQVVPATPSPSPPPEREEVEGKDQGDGALGVESIISKSMWHLKRFISSYAPSPARVFPNWQVTELPPQPQQPPRATKSHRRSK